MTFVKAVLTIVARNTARTRTPRLRSGQAENARLHQIIWNTARQDVRAYTRSFVSSKRLVHIRAATGDAVEFVLAGDFDDAVLVCEGGVDVGVQNSFLC